MELLAWRTYRLREDLGIPIIVLNSEFEAEQCWPNTQPDTDEVRWWEIAGTAHMGLVAPEMMDAMRSALPGACTVSFAPANRAALHALRRWLDGEGPPPHQPRLLKTGEPPAFPRDEHGNALGGIRWPDVEAPLGTHVGESPSEGYVQLMGHSAAFPPEKVRALYPDHATWLAQYTAAVDRLVEDQVVLPDDAAGMIARASTLELPS
ncbi:MAG: alpha/beta hydrolase domain-containing protein [Acidimicrobiia bacterium]